MKKLYVVCLALITIIQAEAQKPTTTPANNNSGGNGNVSKPQQNPNDKRGINNNNDSNRNGRNIPDPYLNNNNNSGWGNNNNSNSNTNPANENNGKPNQNNNNSGWGNNNNSNSNTNPVNENNGKPNQNNNNSGWGNNNNSNNNNGWGNNNANSNNNPANDNSGKPNQNNNAQTKRTHQNFSSGFELPPADGDIRLRQLHTNSCWAASGAMVKMYHDHMSISEVSLVNSLGQPFIQIYADDRGLFANDEDEFVSAMGMHSTNFSFDVTPQFIQNKLETTRNPLIAIYSSDDRVPQFHAIVIISIAGDGSITDGTQLGIIDPVDGLTHVIPYDEFYRRINLVIDRDDRDRVARAKIIYY